MPEATAAGPIDIRHVGVLGCGLMGSGIAEVCARAGLDVTVVEADPSAAERGLARVEGSLGAAVKRNKMTDEQRDAALSRVNVQTEIDAFGPCDLVVEAILEDPAAKADAFRRIDAAVVSPNAILASNTSSIPIMRIAAATSRPDKVIGIHFFNPVPVLPLVELVTSLTTSAETLDRARHFAGQTLGKQVIVAPDRAGFVVNALLVPFMLSAIRMTEGGHATPEDIDSGMVHGCAHPMGPLALSDLVGLDTLKAVADSMYAEFKEPLYAAPALLCRMVEAGHYGRKSGRGFYTYESK